MEDWRSFETSLSFSIDVQLWSRLFLRWLARVQVSTSYPGVTKSSWLSSKRMSASSLKYLNLKALFCFVEGLSRFGILIQSNLLLLTGYGCSKMSFSYLTWAKRKSTSLFNSLKWMEIGFNLLARGSPSAVFYHESEGWSPENWRTSASKSRTSTNWRSRSTWVLSSGSHVTICSLNFSSFVSRYKSFCTWRTKVW